MSPWNFDSHIDAYFSNVHWHLWCLHRVDPHRIERERKAIIIVEKQMDKYIACWCWCWSGCFVWWIQQRRFVIRLRLYRFCVCDINTRFVISQLIRVHRSICWLNRQGQDKENLSAYSFVARNSLGTHFIFYAHQWPMNICVHVCLCVCVRFSHPHQSVSRDQRLHMLFALTLTKRKKRKRTNAHLLYATQVALIYRFLFKFALTFQRKWFT